MKCGPGRVVRKEFKGITWLLKDCKKRRTVEKSGTTSPLNTPNSFTNSLKRTKVVWNSTEGLVNFLPNLQHILTSIMTSKANALKLTEHIIPQMVSTLCPRFIWKGDFSPSQGCRWTNRCVIYITVLLGSQILSVSKCHTSGRDCDCHQSK